MAFYCYIVTNRRNGTLYIGSTDDLVRRVGQHKLSEIPGFTAKYGCDRLVWYAVHGTRESAMTQEKRMKEWRRVWKLRLIEEGNPDWRDLYWEAAGLAPPGTVQAITISASPAFAGEAGEW